LRKVADEFASSSYFFILFLHPALLAYFTLFDHRQSLEHAVATVLPRSHAMIVVYHGNDFVEHGSGFIFVRPVKIDHIVRFPRFALDAGIVKNEVVVIVEMRTTKIVELTFAVVPAVFIGLRPLLALQAQSQSAMELVGDLSVGIEPRVGSFPDAVMFGE
jgi:hypothetical protein